MSDHEFGANDDLSLPKATVQKIVSEILPPPPAASSLRRPATSSSSAASSSSHSSPPRPTRSPRRRPRRPSPATTSPRRSSSWASRTTCLLCWRLRRSTRRCRSKDARRGATSLRRAACRSRSWSGCRPSRLRRRRRGIADLDSISSVFTPLVSLMFVLLSSIVICGRIRFHVWRREGSGLGSLAHSFDWHIARRWKMPRRDGGAGMVFTLSFYGNMERSMSSRVLYL